MRTFNKLLIAIFLFANILYAKGEDTASQNFFTKIKPLDNKGIYCKTLDEEYKLYSGIVHSWKSFKESQYTNIYAFVDNSKKGLGFEELVQLKVATSCLILEKKVLHTFKYDMEAGLCGREELKIKKASEIIKINYKKNKVEVRVKEQECKTKKLCFKTFTF